MDRQRRHLAAILFTDIVGYTAMMQQNESKAVAVAKRYLSILQNSVSEFDGEILNDYGDGSLCSFSSATDAVKCAIKIQQDLKQEPTVPLRIGLHVGEIFFENNKVFGDGVNVASRVQSLGQANTILFSGEINNKIKNNPEFKSISLGKFQFKNVDDPVEVFALANDGFTIPKKEQLSGKLKDATKKSSSKKIIIAIAIVLLLIAAGFLYKKYTTKPDVNKEKTIAILPFKNVSVRKEENEPFCVGVVLELQKKIELLGALIPIAPQSVERFRDTKLSIAEIAKDLGGISYILQGTVLRDKNDVDVHVWLIDAITGDQKWHKDYTGVVEDVFTLQENIAQQIASQLEITITPDEQKRIARVSTKNTKALDAYNEALNAYVTLIYTFQSTYSPSIFLNPKLYADYQKTLSLCDHVLELDSSMAEGYVLKAKTLLFKYDKRYRFPGLLDSIMSIGQKALSLNNNSVDALIILASYYQNRGDQKSTELFLQKGHAISPNNFEVNWELGKHYTVSDPEKSVRFLRKSLRLNPLSVWTPWVYQNLGTTYLTICDFEKAELSFKKTIELSSNSSATAFAIFGLAVTYQRMNKPDSVFKYTDWGVRLGDNNAIYFKAEAYCYLKNDCAKAAELYEYLWNKIHQHNFEHRWAIALWKAGKKPELAQQLFDSSFAREKAEHPMSYDLAGMYAYKGHKENAYRILKEIDWEWGMPYLIKVDPLFDNLRNDKEFKELVQKAIDEKTKLREKIRKMEEAGEL
jgi:TolB-like protein